MYESVAFPLAKKLAKLTTIFLLAGVAAGCSNELTRFSEGPFSNPFPSQADPVTTGSVSAPQRIRSVGNDAPLVSAAPIRPLKPEVSSSPLVRRTASNDMLPPPQSAPQLMPNPPAMRDIDPIVTGSTAPAAAGAMQAVSSYQGWTKKGGIPFTLGQDDTVTSVAKRFGIPVAALLAVNGLSSPADALPGTKLILPVLSSAAASPARPIASDATHKVAEATPAEVEPRFLFQVGAPFSARAAQIPFEARPAVTLANADEGEAAILRKKLKKLQEEVDALEASEAKKKTAAKPAKAKIEETSSSAVERPATAKKKVETARAPVEDAVAKPKVKKVDAEKVASADEGKPKNIKAPMKTEASSEKLAAAPEARKLQPKKTAAESKVATAKPATEKQVAAKDAAPKARSTKDAAKPKAIAKAETTSSTKPKAEKLASAEKTTAKKAKPEQIAKAEPKIKVKAKPARVVEAAPEKVAAPAEATQVEDAVPAPSADDDAIVTAKVDPVPPAAVDPGFRWPARGRVIQGFDGTGNRGVKIAMPEGTPVKSAGAGKVIYVGEDVKGYGKLVLVRHVDGYVSAYGNNSELLVKRGEEVGRGQELARSGATGDVSSPMLHFELRKGAQAVDPMAYLK
jgi:murein DD-endopeptidase MepM/ murein hydrolase activator NlpD